MEGEFGVTCAAELKSLLLERLASEKALQVDLGRAEEIDITLLQLLWAAGREAAWKDAGIVSSVSDAAASAARDAGFDRFPGTDLAK